MSGKLPSPRNLGLKGNMFGGDKDTSLLHQPKNICDVGSCKRNNGCKIGGMALAHLKTRTIDKEIQL